MDSGFDDGVLNKDVSKMSRGELVEMVSLYRAAVSEDAAFVVESDEDGYYFLDVNRSFSSETGLESGDVLGEDVEDVFRSNRVTEHFDESLERGSSVFESELLGSRDVSLESVEVGDKILGRHRFSDRTEELRQEVKKLDLFRENIDEVLWITTGDLSDSLFISDSYEDVMGRSAEKARDDPLDFVEAIHPEDRDEIEQRIGEWLEKPYKFDETYRILKNGEVRWINTIASVIYGDDGEPEFVTGVSVDVTDRVEHKNKLEQYREVFNQTYQFIGLVETDGTLIEANDTALEFVEKDRGEVVGKPLWEAFWWDADESVKKEIREAVEQAAEGQFVRFETRHRSDGSEVTIDFSLKPVFGESEEVDYIIPEGRNITERKVREQELRNLINGIKDSVFVHRLDGDIVEVNETATSKYGYTKQEFLDMNAEDLVPKDSENIVEHMNSVAEEGDQVFETTTVTKNGREIPVEIGMSLIRYFGDESLIAVVRDISGRRRREDQLRILDRVLRHNLHNKINVISGYVESLMERAGEDIQYELDVIKSTGSDLLRTTDKEREIVDLITGEKTRTVIDVEDTLRAAKETVIEEHPDAEIILDTEENGDLVRAVPEIERGFEEVMDNAIRHYDGDEPTVEVTFETLDDAVEIQVSDNGPGIPEMEVKVLKGQDIEPLFHGSGLGLWLVNWIVEKSNGGIDLYQNTPTGSVVEITLPRS